MDVDLERYRAGELKKAARFWVGKEAAGFCKDESIRALTKVFKGKTAAKKVVPRLSDKQKQLLGIFARYGPAVSGSVLSVEVEQRGLVEKKNDDSPRSYYSSRRNDVVNTLCDKLVLIGAGYYYAYYAYAHRYPDLALHPAIADAIAPAEPRPWKPSKSSPDAKPSFARSSAEPALDLWRVADALREMRNWKTVKGDALSKGSRNKLRKLVPLPTADTDELAAPDPESLFYELLREMGFLSVAAEPRLVLSSAVEQHFDQPPVVQAWCWLRAWLDIRLWQDGIGVVPDRDSNYDPVRIEPDALRQVKELLIWALCGVAHAQLNWLDLEGFLKDFWNATHEVASSFYWVNYSWNPDFALARRKDKIPVGPERILAFWLDDEGGWVANAIMVTLATLGLIERGESGGKKKRLSFRLTPLGRQVFGAPELSVADQPVVKPFLTIQPNHDILAYLDAADARRVCTLARFARRGSAAGGHVQTFSLSRESVYAALESGLSIGEIETFLTEHAKTTVPANVLRALQEWSGKRESLVLRTGVTVALTSDPARLEELGSKLRTLGDTTAVLPNLSAKKAVKDFAGWSVLNHHAALPHVWQVDELGRLQSTGDDVVSHQRLASFADRSADGWLISNTSVARARKQGFTADQMLKWLAQHLTHKTPALLALAIRNWTGRTSAFAGKLQLIQITRAEARDAILHSDAFEPLLAGHIPPDWFLVRDGQTAAVKKLLKQLGFCMDGGYQVASLDESRNPVPEPKPKPAARTPRRRVRRRRRA